MASPGKSRNLQSNLPAKLKPNKINSIMDKERESIPILRPSASPTFELESARSARNVQCNNLANMLKTRPKHQEWTRKNNQER